MSVFDRARAAVAEEDIERREFVDKTLIVEEAVGFALDHVAGCDSISKKFRKLVESDEFRAEVLGVVKGYMV